MNQCGDELLSYKYSQIYTDDEVLRCMYAIMDHSLLNSVSLLKYIPFFILLSPSLLVHCFSCPLSLCPLLLLPLSLSSVAFALALHLLVEQVQIIL